MFMVEGDMLSTTPVLPLPELELREQALVLTIRSKNRETPWNFKPVGAPLSTALQSVVLLGLPAPTLSRRWT